MQNGKELILVDLDDRETGTGEKLEVHRQGLLHRAFSMFLFDGERLLVQRRADGKYHSAGLWANTCLFPSAQGGTARGGGFTPAGGGMRDCRGGGAGGRKLCVPGCFSQRPDGI